MVLQLCHPRDIFRGAQRIRPIVDCDFLGVFRSVNF